MPQTTTEASRANRTARRWEPAKAPQRRPAAVRSGRPAPACPVADLAGEAAAAHRLRRSLYEHSRDCDAELVEALNAPAEGVSSTMLLEELWDRIKAIEEAASHRRATSLKGALFQLYLAANHSFDPRGLINTRLTPGEVRDIEENDRRVGRLHHAALAFVETLAMDNDLAELRRWYCSPLYDAQAVCERGMIDRAGLIAEARARVARETAAGT